MMQCPSCKNPIEQNHYFCGYCGTDLKRADSDPGSSMGLVDGDGQLTGSTDSKEGEKSSYIGQIIDRRYQVLDLIARGGMGSVYRVVHIHMRKVLAIKLLHEHILAKRKHVTRFLREARAISRLSNPHTVRVYDFGKYREVFYLVMEFLDGEDLFAVLEREGPLGVSRTVTILDQICSSLEEAHSSGIIHRDLKSENIMVIRTRDGRDFIKVLDFGLAKILDPNEPVTAQSQSDLFGTPFYMAPEQIRGKQVDTRTDLYALGALSFRMLTGMFPFTGDTAFDTLQSHLSDPVPKLHAEAPDLGIPKWLDNIVQRCLAKDPDERFPDVRALRRALRSGPGTEFLGLEELDQGPDGEVSERITKPTNRRRGLRGRSLRGIKANYLESGDLEFDPSRSRRSRKRIRALLFVLTLVSAVSLGLHIMPLMSSKSSLQGRETEPNNLLAAADQIPESRIVFGHLGRRLSRDQSDKDVFRLKVPETGVHVLKVQADSIPNMNIRLTIMDLKGDRLALVDRNPSGQGESMAQIPVAPPHVFVQIDAKAHREGALPTENLSDLYRIMVQLDPYREGDELEPNDTKSDAGRIAVGESIFGQLDEPTDRDYFLLSSGAQDLLIGALVMQSHLGMPVRAQLLTASGDEVLTHTFPGLRDKETIHFYRTWPKNKRVFLLVSVGRRGRAWGVYRVGINRLSRNDAGDIEPNNAPENARFLAFNKNHEGTLSARDRVDLYKIPIGDDLKEQTLIQITSSSRKPPRIQITAAPDQNQTNAETEPGAVPSSSFTLTKQKSGNYSATITVPRMGPEVILELRHPGGRSRIDYELRPIRKSHR